MKYIFKKNVLDSLKKAYKFNKWDIKPLKIYMVVEADISLSDWLTEWLIIYGLYKGGANELITLVGFNRSQTQVSEVSHFTSVASSKWEVESGFHASQDSHYLTFICQQKIFVKN